MVLIAVMVSAAAFTYQTKHEAENELETVRKLEAQIRYEEDTIDLLKADWSLLTQPARLQRLAELYQTELPLQSAQARQFVGLEDIPEKPIDIPGATSQAQGGMAQNGAATDPTVTGGVSR